MKKRRSDSSNKRKRSAKWNVSPEAKKVRYCANENCLRRLRYLDEQMFCRQCNEEQRYNGHEGGRR